MGSERAEPGGNDTDDDNAALGTGSVPAPPLGDAAWRRLGQVAAGSLATSWDPASLVERALARAQPPRAEAPAASEDTDGALAEVVPRVLPLAQLARAGLGPPRPRSLQRLAASLGITFVEAETPLAQARLAATCLLALLDREPLRHLGERGLSALLEKRAAPIPALENPLAPLRRQIESLPAEPGVYRFFDRNERLLYVGKARDLRRRVGSYFATRERLDPRTTSWLGSVERIEHERSGSELEALLREERQIVVRAPSKNKQRAVHERGGKAQSSLVLVQQAERRSTVRIALVKDGAIVAKFLLGPRGGGHARLRKLIGQIYFPDGAPPALRHSQRRASAASSSARPASAAAHALVQSWLRRQPPSIATLDPTDDPGPDEACARILRYVHAFLDGETDVTFR